ncbi:MAG: M13-type metalloendopeptidase [Exiguobacterium sp.]|jgi:predicted metalloendopeptidase
MVKGHAFVALFFVVALACTNFVYVQHETNKRRVNLDKHPTFRPLFDRTTRQLPNSDKTCGVGWEYRAEEGQCVRRLQKAVDGAFVRSETDTCTDFFDSSCGAFNTDPANAHETNLFSYAQRLNNENIEELLSDIANGDASTLDEQQIRVKTFHKSCVMRNPDSAVEFSGSRLLRSLLSAVDTTQASASYDNLAVLWGYLQRYDTILPLELSLELDPWDTKRLLPSIRWSGVSTAESISNVTKRLSLIYSPVVARSWAEYIVRIERDLIDISPPATTNFFAYLRQGRSDDFIDDWLPLISSPAFNISRFILACAPDPDKTREWMDALSSVPMWTASKEYLLRLPEVISRYTLETWLVYTKHAILYHLDNDRTPKLAYHRLYDAQHVLPWTRLRYSETPTTGPAATCVQLTRAFLPVTVDRLYARKYFTDQVKERATEVATAVHRHFAEKLTLIGDVEGEQKISRLRLDIGFSEDIEIPKLTLREDAAYVDNVLAARRYHIEANYRLIFRANLPLSVFSDGLATSTSAFYQHQLNGLTVSVGMLQPPLFSPEFDDSHAYARLGMFVAHEIAHSIDKTGRLFSPDGSYLGGTESAHYTPHEQCLIDQYSGLTALGNTHNGAQTLNENFADTLGLQVAYGAFMQAGNRSEDERRDFFRAYAQMFCQAPMSTIQEQLAIVTNRHSLPAFRVNNVVSSVHDFQDVWHCKNQRGEFCSYFEQ